MGKNTHKVAIANALTLVLLATLALSFGVQDFIEGSFIAVIIIINTGSVILCVSLSGMFLILTAVVELDSSRSIVRKRLWILCANFPRQQHVYFEMDKVQL